MTRRRSKANAIDTSRLGDGAIRGSVSMPQRWSLAAPLVAIWDEHRYVSRLLVILEEQAEALKRDHRVDLATARGIMDYMTRFPDRYHHPKEDLIFKRMESMDPSITKLTAALRRAHVEITSTGQAILGRLQQAKDVTRADRGHLRQMLVEYIHSIRRHMYYEESMIFEPAKRLLKATDWKAIDEAIAPIIDPIFGERKADEYLPLFGAYLNRLVPVATGSIPAGLFETAAGAIERLAHAAGPVRSLPGRLLSHGRKRASRQWSQLTSLAGDGSLGHAFTALGNIGATCLSGPAEYCAVFCDAVFGTGNDDGGSPRKVLASAQAADGEILTFRERNYRANQSAGISWQAVAVNLLLRLTLKPMLARVDTRNAKRISRLMSKVDRVPSGLHLVEVENEAFHAQWVRSVGLKPKPGRTILFLPGGGFFFPPSVRHAVLLADLARRTRARGLMVHYRLAPEHPFPAGLEDAVAAYRYLLDSGSAAEHIVVVGDSAGGGLSLSLLMALRQEHLPLPAGIALLSALADLSFSTPSRKYNRWRDPLLPTTRRLGAFDLYAGATPRDHPLLSPVYGDYRGFPPMFAQVGSTETLLDDTLRVARKARAQGVDFEVEVWEGMPHDWQLFPFIPESRQALTRLADFFEKAWSAEDRAVAAPPRVSRGMTVTA